MTARDRILKALRVAGGRGATTSELCQPDVGGVRFGARIKELRDDGYAITAVLERPGSHRYTLVPNPSGPVAPATPASPPQAGAAGSEDPEPALFDLTFEECCPPMSHYDADAA